MKLTDLVPGREYRIQVYSGVVVGQFIERVSRKVSYFKVDQYQGQDLQVSFKTTLS